MIRRSPRTFQSHTGAPVIHPHDQQALTGRISSLTRLLAPKTRRFRSESPVDDDLRYRLAAMLIPEETVDKALSEVHRLHDWVGAWNRAAQRFLAESRREETIGSWELAAVARRNAAMCYHVANLISDDDPRTIRALRASAVQCFSQAVPRLMVGTRKVAIPWRTRQLQAYLSKPPDRVDPMPVVVMLNGGTTTKEEMLLWSGPIRDAEMAVLAIDWPGTGEAAGNLKFSSHCDDMTDGIWSLVSKDEDLDETSIAILGVSVGSVVALRAAAMDRRVAAVIVVTPPFEPRPWAPDVAPELARQLVPLAGQAASLPIVLEDFAVIEVIHRVRCPILVVGAGQDLVMPPSEAMQLAASAGELATLVWYEDAGHCAFDRTEDWMTVTAPWLSGLFALDPDEIELEPESTQVESSQPDDSVQEADVEEGETAVMSETPTELASEAEPDAGDET
jgi:pimeloyl-ACP methyl ester carboxylesterase